MAKIRTRVRELLHDLQQRDTTEDDARAGRIAAIEGEIDRLIDAVAQTGLSGALRTRLVAAEAELATLTAAAGSRPTTRGAYNTEQIGVRIREVAMRLEKALYTDVDIARKILADKLGDIRVEERDDGVYAQMDIGPVLLEAVGADVSRSGCGGRI